MASTNLKKSVNGYNYKYTDLAQIHEYLESMGMRYIQSIERIDGDDYVMTKRFVDGNWEDFWIRGARVVQATLKGVNNPAQEQGSALTYARRYSVLMAFGLATTDDDAQCLSTPKLTPEEEKAKKELEAEYGDGTGEVTTAQKEALKIKCKQLDVPLEMLLGDVGWTKGSKINQEQYGRAMNILIKEEKAKAKKK